MRRSRKNEDSGVPETNWMVTFSDMVTLILTFFVMIISITSMDPKTLEALDGPEQTVPLASPRESVGPGALMFSNPTILEPVVELIENMETLPENTVLDQREIKAAIFQIDPQNVPDYQNMEREVNDSISIFHDERGLVIKWDKAILFPEGSVMLREEAMVLLNQLSILLGSLSLPVSIECHTNPLSELEGGDHPESYLLATSRAKVVLDYLLGLGLKEDRFRLGAYGGSRPVTTIPARGSENSRLEIIIYKPAKSSWKG